MIIVVCFLIKKETCKFKANNKTTAFPTRFCSGITSEIFSNNEPKDVCFKINVLNFSFDYAAIDKSDISNFHKKLMVKKINKMFQSFKRLFIGLLASIVNASNRTKCISLDNQLCMDQTTIINLQSKNTLQDKVTIQLQLI